MVTKTKTPKQLYVVSRSANDWEYPIKGDYSTKIETSHNFGFLHPHEPQLKTDDRRKRTQIEWAYSNGEPYQIGDQWWIKGVKREYDRTKGAWNYEPFDHPMDPQYAPRVWVNEP